MDNINGALGFKSTLDNQEFIGAINEAERRVKGFSQATVKEGTKIDDAFRITAENIKIQKDVIAQAEAQIKRLNARIDKTAPGLSQNELRRQAAQLTAELNGEKQALIYLEQQVKETEASHVSFRTQLRNVREELIAMEQAGLRGTAEYDKLQRKAGELNDAYLDVQQQMTVLANDEKGFQGIVSMTTGLTGAFSAAQGAVALFTGENENLNRVMLRVQSLMAITIGMQQVAQTLNKDSYFSVVILSKAKNMLAIAEMKLATAFGISSAAARAFLAAITLGFSAAITAVIILVDKFVSKQKEAAKQQQEFNTKVADSAFKSLTEFERLSKGWTALGDNMKSKKKFVDDNAKAFEELGIQTKNVADIEDILIKNRENFVQSIIAKAKAAAAMEMASEKYKQAVAKMMEADKLADTKTKYQTSGYMGQGSVETYEVENRKKTRLKEQAAELQREGDALINQSLADSEKATKLVEGLTTENINAIIEGSIEQIEEAIRMKQEALKKLTNPADYAKAMAEIKKLEEKIRYIRGEITYNRPAEILKDAASRESTGITLSDELKADLNTLKEAYAEFSNVQIEVTEKFNELNRRALKERINELKELSASHEMSAENRMIYLLALMKAEQALADQTSAGVKTVIGLMRNAVATLGDDLAQVAGNIVNSAEGIYDAVNAVKTDSGSTTSQVTGLISGIMSLTASLRDWRYESIGLEDPLEQQKSEYEAIAAWVDTINSKLERQRAIVEELAGAERVQATFALMDEYERRQSETMKRLTDLDMQYINDQWKEYVDSNIKAEGANKVANFLLFGGQAKTETVYEFKTIDTTSFKDIEQYRDLLLEIEQSGGYYKGKEVVEADLNALKALIDGYDQFMSENKGLKEAIDQYMTGTTSESISNSIAEGFAQGKRSAADFAGNFEDLMRNAALQALRIKAIDEPVQQFYEDMVSAMGDQSLTETEKEALRSAYNDIIAGASDMAKQMEEITGGTISDTDKSLTGGIKGVTEETASMLGGQINAIRINQAEALESMRSQLIHLSNIDRNTSHLQKIDTIISLLGGTVEQVYDESRSTGLVRR